MCGETPMILLHVFKITWRNKLWGTTFETVRKALLWNNITYRIMQNHCFITIQIKEDGGGIKDPFQYQAWVYIQEMVIWKVELKIHEIIGWESWENHMSPTNTILKKVKCKVCVCTRESKQRRWYPKVKMNFSFMGIGRAFEKEPRSANNKNEKFDSRDMKTATYSNIFQAESQVWDGGYNWNINYCSNIIINKK